MSTAPPGWYANPVGDGERYWDGQAWTRHLRVPQPPPPTYLPPTPPPPRVAVPPPPKQPPPPMSHQQTLGVINLGDPHRRIPRWAWYGFAAFGALIIVGAAMSPEEAETAAVETSTTTGTATTTDPASPSAAVSLTTEGTATTTPTPVTEPPETLDAASMEGVTFGLLAVDVNRGFGDAYERDPEGAVALVEPGAEALCDMASESDTIEEFTAKSVVVWLGLDPATQGMFGSAEGFGRGTAILMNWKCPSEAARLFA